MPIWELNLHLNRYHELGYDYEAPSQAYADLDDDEMSDDQQKFLDLVKGTISELNL